MDFDVGWWSPGTWLNYTRTFPANTYLVYGRLAAGASPIVDGHGFGDLGPRDPSEPIE